MRRALIRLLFIANTKNNIIVPIRSSVGYTYIAKFNFFPFFAVDNLQDNSYIMKVEIQVDSDSNTKQSSLFFLPGLLWCIDNICGYYDCIYFLFCSIINFITFYCSSQY